MSRINVSFLCLCGQSVEPRQYHPRECCESFKAGQRKVVEWLERCKKIEIPKYQLKEWGIDD